MDPARPPGAGPRSRPRWTARPGSATPPTAWPAAGRRRPGRRGRARAGALAGRGLPGRARAATGPRPAGWRPAASRPGRWPPAAWPATCARSAGTRRPSRWTGSRSPPPTTVEARADALIGLVADAVGRHELALARDRLEPATEQIVAVTSDHTEWRARVRLEWVSAETALLAGDAARAVEIGRTAQRISRTAMVYRHTVKSTLVLGVALDAAGRTRAAARVLRTASRGATRLGLIPLLSPIHSVLAGTLQDRAPRVAARERLRADAAQSIREDPAESQSFQLGSRTDRTFVPGPGRRKLSRPGFPLHHPDGLQSRGRSTSRGVMHGPAAACAEEDSGDQRAHLRRAAGGSRRARTVHVRRTGRGPGRHRGQRGRHAGAVPAGAARRRPGRHPAGRRHRDRAHPPAGLPAPAGLRAGLRRRRRHREHRRRGGLRGARIPALGRVARRGLRGARARAGRRGARRAAAGPAGRRRPVDRSGSCRCSSG